MQTSNVHLCLYKCVEDVCLVLVAFALSKLAHSLACPFPEAQALSKHQNSIVSHIASCFARALQWCPHGLRSIELIKFTVLF